MARIPSEARAHYNKILVLKAKVLALAVAAGQELAAEALTASWAAVSAHLVAGLEVAQRQAAVAGSEYTGMVLAQQGKWVPPTAWVDPESFVGWSQYGQPLSEYLGQAPVLAKTAISQGKDPGAAVILSQNWLKQAAGTLIADTARQAASVDIAARRSVGYVRMLNPPSCDRCTILAGKFYAWNTGFLRHPNCDCVHVASTAGSTAAAEAEGLVDNPHEYFDSLSAVQQDRIFGPGNAQAIRDGADIYQVVNSKRGRKGGFTTEGTTRRGWARSQMRKGQRRMTPDAIYRTSNSREEALAALRQNGYLFPDRREQTLQLAGKVQSDYAAVLEGRNPYSPTAPLTPEISAKAEYAYRGWFGK